ncbi:hypothetical protein D8674_019074 [Pyrus ussuriensis x Pyrus communis]|uniref:Uncharacterized protein n=1 Tax=Pyrus ussuriensis x Pyrus communis TaxID=2448454 RepID=A0A5N5GC66_9ROSA|nr:hypothetical protein D8674_019074 [Pyrus ussuriensis x Pyrus communis]
MGSRGATLVLQKENEIASGVISRSTDRRRVASAHGLRHCLVDGRICGGRMGGSVAGRANRSTDGVEESRGCGWWLGFGRRSGCWLGSGISSGWVVGTLGGLRNKI